MSKDVDIDVFFAFISRERSICMKKKSFIQKKNGNNVFALFLLLLFFLALSLIIPAIGAGPTAPALWISIVNFFKSVKDHFAAYWMFYSFGAVILIAYLTNRKK